MLTYWKQKIQNLQNKKNVIKVTLSIKFEARTPPFSDRHFLLYKKKKRVHKEWKGEETSLVAMSVLF
jgi:hypothetical protein